MSISGTHTNLGIKREINKVYVTNLPLLTRRHETIEDNYAHEGTLTANSYIEIQHDLNVIW